MNYTEQIAEFHKRKGLTGKRLRRAVLNDTIRAKHYGRNSGNIPHPDVAWALITLFTWHSAPEGANYWAARSIGVVSQRRSEVWT